MTVIVLTAEQELAVARRAEPLLLSAAAGSGKTSVLVERFVAAVRDDGIAPSRILAITFTERAAGELRERVRARLLALGDRDGARDAEAAFVGTFHGFCARLLRAHALAAGLDPRFAILDEGLAGRLRELAFATALRELFSGRRAASISASSSEMDDDASPAGEGEGEAVDALAAYGVDRVRAMIEQVHGELRSRGERLPRLPPADAERDGEAARMCALLDELLRGFAVAYERLKHARRAVDFDDLELLTRDLLVEREDLRAAWCERFALLMVDEFQDTNPRQLGILAALERGNLFTVGDELQSIYGFRHADVSLFRARREQLEELGGSLRLTQNFRSRESLLHVVNAVFAERFCDYRPLRAGRAEADAPAWERVQVRAVAGDAREVEREQDPEVELLLTDIRGWEEREDLSGPIAAGLPHAQLWRQAEARMLAQRVGELVRAGVAHAGEVVVLVRASGDLEVFERALQLEGLRTLAVVGTFWRRQQIVDLISWLRVLANPLDEEALYAALASPLGGCSLDCLALLAQAAREQRRSVWEAALAAHTGTLGTRLADADRQALAVFCARLQGEREAASRRTVAELIQRALDTTGYRQHVLALDWAERRLANVHKLLRLARRFEASEGRDLRAFLDHVEHLRQSAHVEPDAPVASSPDGEVEVEGEDLEPDAVRLMTIHAAKGLEFPVVCLADLGRQPNTQAPDLLVDGQRMGLRLARLDAGGSTPALDYESLYRERREREAEEEDRILYVAMTRARERLLLSGAVDFARWPAPRQGAAPISWLARALSAELPALALSVDTAVHDLPIGPGGGYVRCRLNTPATAGAVLRLERLQGQSPAPAETPSREAPSAGGEQLSLSLAAHVGGPVLPPALSYTSLSELERCGYRYYLEHVLGLPEQPARSAAATEHVRLEARARGTLIHRLMESLDFARPDGVCAERVAELARQLGVQVGSHERAEIAELITAACASPLAARVAAAMSVRREHPFAFSPSPPGEASSSEMDAVGPRAPLITGVIDLLAQESDGGYLILDYKSDRLDAGTDLTALVAEHYVLQRELYALALLRDAAASVEVVHWFLERPHEWVSARFHAHERQQLQARLAARIAHVGEQRFAVSDRPHVGLCLTCPGRGSLCSWNEAETLRKNPSRQPAH